MLDSLDKDNPMNLLWLSLITGIHFVEEDLKVNFINDD